MPLTRLIVLLSALLVISPLMSQLAMASFSHSSSHHPMAENSTMESDSVNAVEAVNECACCDKSTGQSCPESGCQCDACVTVMIHSVPPSQNSSPQATNNRLHTQFPLETVLAIVTPPPIFIL